MIEQCFELGEPVEHRGVVIAPLFPRADPRVAYLTLEEALPLGFCITEVDETGSVTELIARNPLDRPVLLYDGEGLLGLKQNRILYVTFLVSAQTETRIPVSCVEQGRWNSRTDFVAAPHVAYADLRRLKAEYFTANPFAPGAAQAALWKSVADKAARLRICSATLAAADIYSGHEETLASLRDAFPPLPEQTGALLGLGPDRLCLDYVSRPAAFASLYRKLLDGYLLDALECLDQEPASLEQFEGFIDKLVEAPHTESPSVGAGDYLQLASHGIVGSGLALDGELLQLCAFTSTQIASDTSIMPLEPVWETEYSPSAHPVA